MKRFSARRAVLEDLKAKELYRGTKENPMVVPICRCVHLTIVPYICTYYYMTACMYIVADSAHMYIHYSTITDIFSSVVDLKTLWNL